MRKPPRLPSEQLEPYLLSVPVPGPGEEAARLDWRAVFNNDNPVEVEVGFGKGLFLLTAAQQNLDVNFLGIEIERKYQLMTATRIAKRALPNVRLARADARAFLRDHLPAASVQVVHVYFPDPWWKKRHHKRRLFTEDFARQCARVLAPGGHLHVATDVEDYFHVITELMTSVEGLTTVPPPSPKDPEHDLDYLTNFERKFRQRGKPIYRASYRRTPPS